MIDWQLALRLCLVIGPSDVSGDWLWVVGQAIAGGVSSVQLRDKTLSDESLLQLAILLQQLLPQNIPLIINDRLSVARALGLALHIGQRDCPYSHARQLLGEQAVIGLSIENVEQAHQYKACGANYFGVGPVFATTSKPDAAAVIGVEQANLIVGILQPTPVVFIGGINQHNVGQCQSAAGIAVISALTESTQPKIVAQQLLRGDYAAA